MRRSAFLPRGACRRSAPELPAGRPIGAGRHVAVLRPALALDRPSRGGRSQAVAGSAARPYEYYFGATGGGIWKTTDAGHRRGGPSPTGRSRRRRSARIQIAAVESRRRVCRDGGDAAARQHHPGRRRLQDDRRRQDVDAHGPREDPGDLPHPHPSDQSGRRVRRRARQSLRRRTPNAACSASKDGGKTWERVLFRDDKTGAVDLVIDPKNPDVLYATLWEVFRTPHSLSSGGPGSGLFKIDRRRHDVDRADEERRAAGADLGQDRHRGVGRRQQPPLRHHRGEGRRHLHVGRRRRDAGS